MTASTIIASLVVGMAFLSNPAAADDPTPAPTANGGITITIPLVSGVNDGGSTTGGTTGGSGGGGSGGSAGGGGATGGAGCTVTSPPAAPIPASSPRTGAARLAVHPSQVAEGSVLFLTSTGFQAGENVQIVSYPGAHVLGNMTARADGTLHTYADIPARLPTGPTTIEATGWLDCHVANGSVLIVSSSRPGSSLMPWLGWIVAGGGLGAVALCLLIASRLGWLPAFFATRRLA